MHGLHFLWAGVMFLGGLLAGFVANRPDSNMGIVAAAAGAAIVYLLFVAAADFADYVDDLLPCECGKAGKYRCELGDENEIVYKCKCGRRYFIEKKTLFRRHDDGSVEPIARRTWYGRWIPNKSRPSPD